MWEADYARLGVGLALQVAAGLRPSEMLAAEPEHLTFPEDSGKDFSSGPDTLALGPRTGTKVKRPQVAMIMTDEIRLRRVLRLLRSLTPRGCRLFPYSIQVYRNLLRRLELKLGLQIGWTPHSGRAGFATEMRAAGTPFGEIRERGRWAADSSLRTYLDIVGATQVATTLRLSGFANHIAWAHKHWEEYFTPAILVACYR